MKTNTMISGIILQSTATGIRNPRTGRMIKKDFVHKVFNQMGAIVFAKNDDQAIRDSKVNQALGRGLNVVVHDTHAELYDAIPAK